MKAPGSFFCLFHSQLSLPLAQNLFEDNPVCTVTNLHLCCHLCCSLCCQPLSRIAVTCARNAIGPDSGVGAFMAGRLTRYIESLCCGTRHVSLGQFLCSNAQQTAALKVPSGSTVVNTKPMQTNAK
ncbi:unnamed protein product [Ostreobium quekettii]|uniref:Secreted protein n=1 Tax=Ostreobium quekettii TaxID=121088 RepID=A0A8S1IX48_9CHLO|nr:unnamed protein product [Ostreobium quekettii]